MRPGAQSRPAAVSRVRRGQGQINRAHARLDAQHGVRLASDRDLRRANAEQKRDGRKDGHRQLSFLKPMGQERAARRAPHHSCAIRQTPQAIPTTPIPTTRPFGPASYPPRPVAAFAATKAPAHIYFQPLRSPRRESRMRRQKPTAEPKTNRASEKRLNPYCAL